MLVVSSITYDPESMATLLTHHQSPIYLFFFTYVIPITSTFLTAALWTLADIVGSILLVKIWRSRSISKQNQFEGRDHLVALL